MRKTLAAIILLLSTAVQAKTLVFWPSSSDQVPRALESVQSGDTVVFQSGKYKFSSGLVLSEVEDVTVEARGKVELIVDNLDDAVLSVKNCRRVKISGFSARHEKPAPEYQCEGAVIRCDQSEDVFISENKLNGCGAAGVFAMGSKNIVVYKNRIFNNSFAGVWMQDSSALVHGNRIYNNASALITYGECNVSLTENRIENNKGNIFNDSDFFRRMTGRR